MPAVAIIATIPPGETTSNAVDVSSGQLVRVYMPGEWNEAPLTLQVSSDGIAPYRDVFISDGNELVFTVVNDAAVLVSDDRGKGLGFIKLRSGTRNQPIPQDGERKFELVIQTGGPASESAPS